MDSGKSAGPEKVLENSLSHGNSSCQAALLPSDVDTSVIMWIQTFEFCDNANSCHMSLAPNWQQIFFQWKVLL